MAENLELIRHALQVARERKFAEVRLQLGDLDFSATLQPPQPAKSALAAVAVDDAGSGLAQVSAPVVGYYRDGTTPLKVGQKIEKGSIIGVVAALGLVNDVEAPVSGEVVEVLVEPNQPVQYGQTIAMVRPS